VKNILLVGAGQLGSRYLQSLINEKLNYNIIVVDISKISINASKKIWEINGGSNSSHKIYWLSNLPNDIKFYDLAIISTSSKNRASLIKTISSKVNVKNWLLEKILAQSHNQLEIIKKAVYKSDNVYVNMPRRNMDWFKKIKSLIPNKSIKVEKIGTSWNLACNSLHFIDLVSWWTGESLTSINTKNLNNKWFESKRKGYFEVTGSLLGKFSNGSELVLKSFLEQSDEILKINILDKNFCNIYENTGRAVFSNGNIINGKLDLHSEISGPTITKIITDKTCNLPTFNESFESHSIFLEMMLSNWNKSMNKNDKEAPIT
tara:strand:- start:987 stop:1940 length:954 start_codon:yes stop_codon:yes gene_type:complete